MEFCNETTKEVVKVELIDKNGIDCSQDLLTEYADRYDGEYYSLSDSEFKMLMEFLEEGKEIESDGENEWSIFNDVDVIITRKDD